MDAPTILATLRQKFELLCPIMTERMRRHWAGSEALALPRGGITLVAQATGLSRTTVRAGMRELRQGAAQEAEPEDPLRSRRSGGGRHLKEVGFSATVADQALAGRPKRSSTRRRKCWKLSMPNPRHRMARRPWLNPSVRPLLDRLTK
jgi:hypothetical protein